MENMADATKDEAIPRSGAATVSAFEGMNLREIRGMPMTAEATGVALSYWIPPSRRRFVIHPLQVKIALRQERYVREVLLRCPRWRRVKARRLERALAHATTVADFNLRLPYHLRKLGTFDQEGVSTAR